MSNRLYVGNLSYDTDKNALQACFAECGVVTDTHIVMDRETGRARGFGFVTMSTEAEAQNAISKLNGAMLDGRSLRVNIAEERSGGGGGGGGGGRGGGGFGGGGDRGGGGRGGGGGGDRGGGRGGHRGW